MLEQSQSWFRQIWPPLPVWRRLDLAVTLICIYSTIVTAIDHYFGFQPPQWSGISAALTAIVITPLLTFRNREAYERWWEGRKLWGQLINDSRNLILKIVALEGITKDECREAGELIATFAVELKRRLRKDEWVIHRPQEIAGKIFTQMQTWRNANRITDMQVLWLDSQVSSLMNICGACERILNSPVPLSYRALLRHGLMLYLISTPWFIVDHLGYWSIPAIGLLTYFLLGIELTAENVENPFGKDGDDLQLSAYCETIRKSMSDVVGLEITPLVKDGKESTSPQTAASLGRVT